MAMISRGAIIGALTFYQLKKLTKNLYLLLWLAAVTGWVAAVFQYCLTKAPHNHQDWVLSSVNTGMLGAFLLLPLLVRSFMPAFSASGGV
ncbi:MAG: hypothetical protein ACM3O9_05670, partial [Methylocystaceae bacterium]